MFVRKLKIMFIDDEWEFVTPIAQYLADRYQHTTKHVTSIEEAEEELSKNSYDFIFLDYRFPGSSGIDFLRWAVEKKVETPVVMVTGHGAEEIAVEAMKLGAFDYVNKGTLQLDYLPILINNAYERFILRRANRELEQERLDTERQELAIKIFQETVKTFIHRINNDLANIMLRLKMYERTAAKKKVQLDPDLSQTIGEVLYSAEAMEATVAALVSLSHTVTRLHGADKKAVDISEELEKTLRKLQEKAQTARKAATTDRDEGRSK